MMIVWLGAVLLIIVGVAGLVDGGSTAAKVAAGGPTVGLALVAIVLARISEQLAALRRDRGTGGGTPPGVSR